MQYADAIQYLFEKLPVFHLEGKVAYKANLDNIKRLAEFLGHPERNFKTIHVAGTNGKGSVSHMLAAILMAAGYKTGLYTSPHVLDFRERIRINGIMIDEASVTTHVQQHIEAHLPIKASFFEFTTAMAFQYFSDNKVDIAVIETGLGGRLDATNIILPVLSIITNISFDHTDILGESLETIAFEKAGIMKAKTPIIIGESGAITNEVFVSKAFKLGADITFADNVYACQKVRMNDAHASEFEVFRDNAPLCNVTLDLLGDYQSKNIPTVFAAVDILHQKGFNIVNEQIINGLATAAFSTGLIGRWQTLHDNPLIICDTGHNEAGIACTMAQLQRLQYARLHIVIGTVKDKDYKKILSLLPADAIYYFTKALIPRALDEKTLAGEAAAFNLKGTSHTTVADAVITSIQKADNKDVVFIGGSTFVVAEALAFAKDYSFSTSV